MSDFTEIQQKNTLQFFAEWKLMQKLRDNTPDTENEDLRTEITPEIKEKIANSVKDFDSFPKPGEVRLLSQLEKITYAAVMPWDWCHSLLVPLSHYEGPATDKEMLTEDHEKKGLFQQVYQCWNTRTIHNTLLAKSWLVDRLSPEETDRLKKMLHYSLLGDELPEEIKDLTALPIYREEDPRISYMREENERFQALDAMDMALENWMFAIKESSFDEEMRPIYFPAPQQILQAAAGESELSGIYKLDPAGKAEFVTAIECEDFTPIAKGSQIPHFSWFAEKLPFADPASVFFRHAVTGEIIGTGLVFKEKDGFVIQLLSSIPPEEVPEIAQVSDIEIIIQ